MKVRINQAGYIEAIGNIVGGVDAPEFIGHGNFQNYKCVDPQNPLLEASWIFESYLPAVTEEEKVDRDREKGKAVVKRFLVENKRVDISTVQNIALLQAFSGVKELLENGAIVSARDTLASSIPAEAFIVTPPFATAAARRQSYLDELNSFIAEHYPEHL